MEDPCLLDTTAALQPFLTAASETTSAATARALVLKVLADGDIFCGYDQIKAVVLSTLQSAPDGDKLLATLDLFSYGRFADYRSSPSSCIALTDAQLAKLRQLTVLSLVADACRQQSDRLRYDDVQLHLELPDKRSVEDVLIACRYAGALSGQLCQRTSAFLFSGSTSPPALARDVGPEAIAGMLEMVKHLKRNLAAAKLDLQQQQVAVEKQHQMHRTLVAAAKDRVKKCESSTGSTFGVVSDRSAAGWSDSAMASAAVAAAAAATGQSSARRQKRSRGGLRGFQF